MSDFFTVLGVAILATISYWAAAYLISRSIKNGRRGVKNDGVD